MTLRKFLFWPHLIAGTVAGVIIFIMSVTGALLMYEKQIIAWADQRGMNVAASGSSRLPVETLIAKVRDARKAMPSTVAMSSDPAAPAVFAYGRQGSVYVNPYTGELLGEGSKGVREFFRQVTDWHRWLAADGENRPVGRAVTGACNLAFLLLVCSGFYLWWPREWTWRHFKAIIMFRGGLSGKARDFNWHNVIGLWCAVPLFFIVLGGVVISYPWATDLLYRAARVEPPAAGRGQGGPGLGRPAPLDLNLEGFNKLWAQAAQQAPGWQNISLRLPASDRAPLTFLVDQGNAGQPQKRTTVTLSRSGEVSRVEAFSSLDRGRQWRSWLRFVHTGEYYGIVGQTIAGIASAGASLLVWTGIALACRRFIAWRARRVARQLWPSTAQVRDS